MHTIRLSVALALLLGGFGCGKNDSAPTDKQGKPKDTPSLPVTAANSDSNAALKAAQDFVKAVQDGKASSAGLTPAFKKVIAPAELDADKATGFSESGVQAWLDTAKTRIGSHDLKVAYATADFALASADYRTEELPRIPPGKTYLRLIRSNTVWLIDYAIIGRTRTTFPLPVDGQAAPTFAAIAFTEAMLTRNSAGVEQLFSKSAKAKLAPPLFDTDKEQGYSKSKLKSAVADLLPGRPIFTGLVVAASSIKIELNLDGAKKELELRMIPGATPGEFLIDDYQQK